MTEQEKNLVKEVALIFKGNRQRIIDTWTQLVRKRFLTEEDTEFDMLKTAFANLLQQFITCLSAGNLECYYKSSTSIAKEIAYNDISYQKFIKMFHYFEDSYTPVLTERIRDMRIIEYLTAIDNLHHNTIAIISEEYFSVQDITVNALVRLAELRDYTTGGHLERTRGYLKVLSDELNLSEDFKRSLDKAGPLHDIGKVGISDSILLKPFKLTKEEFEEMKKHTIIGAQTIEKAFCEKRICRGYLKMARDIALYHHEKYDGTGYPEGLSGEDIPFSARIFALVDVYDALVSDRPYKNAFSHSKAVEIIRSDSGRHFDPKIVEAFLKVHREFEKISKKYKGDKNVSFA